jgi:putative transposase
MGNHFHMVIHTPRGNISSVMKRINQLYTQYANWRYAWTGHVFEGRFTGILIDDHTYLRDAIAYVLRNPVEARLVQNPEDWPWSSYRAVMGLAPAPSMLTLDWLPQLFPADTIAQSRQMLADCVLRTAADGYQFHLAVQGNDNFEKNARKVIGETLYKAALPRSYRAVARPPLGELLDGVRKTDRRAAILRAHVAHGYLMAEIANHLELHPTTISRIVNRSGSYRAER